MYWHEPLGGLGRVCLQKKKNATLLMLVDVYTWTPIASASH